MQCSGQRRAGYSRERFACGVLTSGFPCRRHRAPRVVRKAPAGTLPAGIRCYRDRERCSCSRASAAAGSCWATLAANCWLLCASGCCAACSRSTEARSMAGSPSAPCTANNVRPSLPAGDDRCATSPPSARSAPVRRQHCPVPARCADRFAAPSAAGAGALLRTACIPARPVATCRVPLPAGQAPHFATLGRAITSGSASDATRQNAAGGLRCR